MSTLTIKLDSQNHWLADGVQVVWNFEFSDGYINRTHVRAYYESDDVEPVRTDLVIDPDTSFVGDFQLLVEPAVPENYTFVIYRATPKEAPLVNFQDGGGVTELNLDTTARQAVFLAQESADFLGVTTTGDLQDLAQTALAAAGSASASAANALVSESSAANSAASALTFSNNASASASAASTSAANSAASASASAAAATTVVTNAFTAYAANLLTAVGSTLVGWIQAGTGAVLRTVQDKLRENVSVEDFGAIGDGVADDSAAFQAAHATGLPVRLNKNAKYKLSTTITAVPGAKNFRFYSSARTARGGKNDPFADLAGPIIEWVGSNSAPIFEVDCYNSQHTEICGISFIVQNAYAGKAINLKGGPYFTTGGVQSVVLERLGCWRRGAISPEFTTMKFIHVDCTGNLADGRVGAGWILRDLFAQNVYNLLSVEVGNNGVGTPGLDNWWNSNDVQDLYGYQVYRLINLVGGTTNGNALWRNKFRGCTNQPGKGLSTLYATGACVNASGLVQYNQFDHCTAWDLSSGSEFVLPELNQRDGYFGKVLSITEGIEVYNPTAAELLMFRRPGWNTRWRIRAMWNDGGRFMMSNNWNGTARDDATAPVAAVVLHAETGVPGAVRLYLGSGPTNQYTFQDGGVVILTGLPTSLPATSGQLWRDSAAGNVLKIVP